MSISDPTQTEPVTEPVDFLGTDEQPPAPEESSSRARISRMATMLAAVTAVVVLTIGSLVAALVVQHGKTSDARADAHRLSITLSDTERDLHKTQGDLAIANNDNEDLTGQVDALTKTAEQCSMLATIADHWLNAASDLNRALSATDFFTKLTKLQDANREIKTVNRLMDENQSYNGELWEVCGPAASGSAT
jgi:hypothetical protein